MQRTIMTRQRSLSITPTYSSDRELLRSNNLTSQVSTVDEAKAALLSLDISNDATFQRRVKSDEEWSHLLQSCTSAETSKIDLEVALKKCYSLAFSMPPSPLSKQRATSPQNPEALVV